MALPSEPNAILLGSGTEYQIARSLRFRASASAYLSRTPSVAGNRQTWTWSAWIKRGRLSSSPGDQFFMANVANTDAGNFEVRFGAGDQLFIYGWTSTWRQTTQVFRDPTAWYHIVIAADTTQATANNRIRLYVNGSEVTSFATITNPAQNADLGINSTGIHRMSGNAIPDGLFFDGYMAEVNFVNAQQLTPSAFGYTDPKTGVWVPKAYTGTYGTNGFYLKFTDNSAATATTIGRDFSGNGNNWTPTNISVTTGVTFDSMLDSPTNYADGGNGRGNYAVLSPLDWVGAANTITAGNLDITTSSSVVSAALATMFVSSGKWYWEFTVGGVGGFCQIGIAKTPIGAISTNGPYQSANAYTYISVNGNKGNNNTTSAYGATYTTNDVIGVALDMDAGTLVFYKNNVSQGTAYSGLTGEFTPIIGDSGNASTISANANFGQRPFAYTPPAGFRALNTQNFPTTSIQNGRVAFDAITYTGNGVLGRTLTSSLGFTPDLVWGKSRSAVLAHALVDSVRGDYLTLSTNLTNAESAINSYNLSTANSLITLNSNETNQNGTTYVAWMWDRAVADGFDIVTYTGTGSAQNISHNLGVVPRFIIIKARNNTVADHWGVYHGSLLNTQNLYLNLTNSVATASMWNSTTPTSSVFTVGANNDVNRSGINYVAYVWAEVPGFSAFQSYVGNGSADGPFVFCGFRPRYILMKNINDNTTAWSIFDTVRSPFNVAGARLAAESSMAEDTLAQYDILSNGFKVRLANSNNTAGQTIVFAAFAENPFKIARAR